MIGPAADIGSPSEVAETVSGGWLDLTGVGGILPSGLEVDADLVPPSSLVQALLTVLSQVLRFAKTEWYLPLLVSSLVLGWLNLLYYTRGFQHTGIYSVMIQKVRDGGRQVQPGKGGLDTPPSRFLLDLQVRSYPLQLS